ncbi:MAG: hypothetical protein AWM53_00868 [Candidatus Dichloromethanomonas elyunquensis]|nr:MAG: hypothetical protein AWM53_00868 [Candidatus Dichloromethanomonas elyunquensis]
MVITLFSIRLWCMVCPLRFVSEIYSKYGVGLQIPHVVHKNRAIIAALLFMILHAAVVSYSPNRLPITTAVYLLILLQYTAIMALLFEKNSFCRVFCPLNGMMSIFSRLGSIGLTRINKEKCRQCTNKTCGKECPMLISPQELPNNSCILCTKCLRNCEKENIDFFRTNPLGKKGMAIGKGEILSIAILLGIAMSEFAERLKEMAVSSGNWNLLLGKIINYIPDKLHQTGLNASAYKLFYFSWEYLIFPVLLILVLVLICKAVFYRYHIAYHLMNVSTSLIPFIFGIFLMVLLNYPFTLLNVRPSYVRKAILLSFLLLGSAASLYVLIRNLISERKPAKFDKSLPI